MDYNLNNLGPNNFEHLIQALSKKILGEGVSIFGAGPDGQREATFTGCTNYPSDKECWDGYWVIQAKFKSASTRVADYPWLKECFETEMKGFESKKAEGKQIPDNYLFFTNVILTPVLEKGIKDKMDELAAQYMNLIPHIQILGADDIKRFLDGNRDVAVCYSSYILSGDILSLLYHQVNEQEQKRQNTFFRYLSQSFENDYCSKMEQAGQLTDDRVSIDKVYVDLNFKYENRNESGKFIENALVVGNELFRFSENQKNTSQPEPSKLSNKYVLKGLAGQGKSTVCQFLAQIYRATFLNNFNKNNSPKINEFINRIKADGILLPTCFRIPLRIELRLFSSWMINRKKEEKNADLITYISSRIGEIASEKFDNETLRLYFENYSWIFFFDGLDEVPESSNRNDVMKEINRFINIELRQVNTDALFFATTRPEGYVGEFKNNEFEHINLLPLDKENCFKYLDKLLSVIEPDSTKRKSYFEILQQGFNNEQISFMMQTPLQATIITILVRAGGEPPRDKYSLFKEYFDIILKREKQKGVGNLLNSNQDLIEGIYYLLGYNLQKRASTSEASDGLLSLDQMKELISQQLEIDGITQQNPEYQTILNSAYDIIVLRINFASQIKEGYIGFSIRSIQEFLAAVYLQKNTSDEDLLKIIENLAKSSYWKNTFIFLVECIAKNKTYYLDNIIDTVLGELNGSYLPVGEIDETSSVYYGSQVAMSLLTNNIFKNKPRYENKLCKYIAKFCELQFSKEFPHISALSDNVKSELTNFLLSQNEIEQMKISLLLVLLKDEKCSKLLEEFAKKHITEIITQLNITNYFPNAILYEVISLALANGQILHLNIEDLTDIIKNAKLPDNFIIKQTLFKSIIRSIMSRPRISKSKALSFLNDYFGCPIHLLSDFYVPTTERIQITDFIHVNPFLSWDDQSSFSKLIDKAEEYALEGLVLILNTIFSKDLNAYRTFYDNINNYKNEVEQLHEISLIQSNKLTFLLYQNLMGDITVDIDKILCPTTQNYLNTCDESLDFIGLLKQCERDILLPKIFITISDNFDQFNTRLRKIYQEDQIRNYPALCNLIVFIYLCSREAYNEDDDSIEHIHELEYLDNQLLLMLEYENIAKSNSAWHKNLIYYAFLAMNLKELVDNLPPYIDSIEPRQISSPFKFPTTAIKIILEKLIEYIDFTGNRSAFKYLYDIVLYNSNFSTLVNCSWNRLIKFGEQRIALLAALSNVTTKNIKETILPMLEDNDLCEFTFQLIQSLAFPEGFTPIYLYLLKKYRAEHDIRKTIILEKAIYEGITSHNANL